VVLAQNDSRLPIDLDNELSVRVLIRQAQSWPYVVFEELFPLPHDLWVTGRAEDGGKFVADWLVPFRGASPTSTSFEPEPATTSTRSRPATLEQRAFAPGSEWLYAKFYLAAALQNRLLTQNIRALLLELELHGWIDRWFFIRYQDPDMHVRLRLHCAPGRDPALLMRRVTGAGGALLETGDCWRFQLDTYEREMGRFGIDGSMVWAESWFHRDSRAVMETLAQHAELSPDRHWLLAAAGLDCLLSGFGFDDVNKKLLMIHSRDAFRGEFGSSRKEIRAAGELFRKFRPQLLDTIRRTRGLARSEDAEDFMGDLQSLRELRVEHQLTPIGEGVRSAGSVISRELAMDFCHLHCNRMLQGAQRMQELVIYDLLVRAYDAVAHGVWADGQ
jgi:thiopeptide-type bacteriocin biosynthesis protein